MRLFKIIIRDCLRALLLCAGALLQWSFALAFLYVYIVFGYMFVVKGLAIIFNTADINTYWYFGGSLLGLVVMTVFCPEMLTVFRGAGESLSSFSKTKPISAYQQSLNDGLKIQAQGEFLRRRGE